MDTGKKEEGAEPEEEGGVRGIPIGTEEACAAVVNGGDVEVLARGTPIQYQHLVYAIDEALKRPYFTFNDFLSYFKGLEDTHGERFWFTLYVTLLYVLRRNIKQECLIVLVKKYGLMEKWKAIEPLIVQQSALSTQNVTSDVLTTTKFLETVIQVKKSTLTKLEEKETQLQHEEAQLMQQLHQLQDQTSVLVNTLQENFLP
ncbi:hypothetical protein Pelo_8370 [Pelomyxa schiedti]|nr:hypothetical protein Pelo_8370 [Pelomyxa schiedti]